MDVEKGKEWGAEDAEPLILLAKERPLAGNRGDPEKLRLPHPSEYQDSPELPARRVASDWADYPPGFNPFSPYEETRPNVLSRLPGHAGKAIEAEGDVWDAYLQSLFDRMREADTLLAVTVYLAYGPWPDFNGEFSYVFSAYVADLGRYELREAPAHSVDGELLWDERCFQRAFVPKDLSWLAKRKRKKAELH